MGFRCSTAASTSALQTCGEARRGAGTGQRRGQRRAERVKRSGEGRGGGRLHLADLADGESFGEEEKQRVRAAHVVAGFPHTQVLDLRASSARPRDSIGQSKGVEGRRRCHGRGAVEGRGRPWRGGGDRTSSRQRTSVSIARSELRMSMTPLSCGHCVPRGAKVGQGRRRWAGGGEGGRGRREIGISPSWRGRGGSRPTRRARPPDGEGHRR